MRLTNIGGFKNIEDFVSWKLNKFASEDKTFLNLFENMFLEESNIMAEFSEGYSTKKVTYGECKSNIKTRANALKGRLQLPKDSIVGLYMDNSLEWIEMFWSILMCGYRPLFMNLRLQDDVLEKILSEHSVRAVVSDGKSFSVETIFAENVCGETCDNYPCDVWGSEVLFMSSGTTDNVKLCAYTAENFYYQLGNSGDIVARCPQIAKHYEGELKQLALLPFYHVFGFIAVYLWFGFFSRTFVFLKDLNPQTIQNTVTRHKVTHIFAVPLVWESVYKAAMRTIRESGDKSYKKFVKGLKIANSGNLGRGLAYRSMAQVRERLFGDSVLFMISGGGMISQDALKFFNGIGYHIVNGYGMTEVGITSVEISAKIKERNLGSIGSPFMYTEYMINEGGELLIKGKNMASRICQGKEEYVTDFNEWFNSYDIANKKDGRYYLCGRCDDLIISKSGENINPQLVEQSLNIFGADDVCLVAVDNEPILIIYSGSCYTSKKANQLINDAKTAIRKLNLENEIHKVYVTTDKLLLPGEIKISRRKIVSRFVNCDINVIDDTTVNEKVAVLQSELEKNVTAIFAEVLEKEIGEISADMHFFSDLGGSSLDYLVASDNIYSRFGVNISNINGKSLCTVSEICKYIEEN